MAKKKAEEPTGKAAPMTYEIRRVKPIDRQIREAIETGEDTVELEEPTVKSVTIKNVEPTKEG